MSLRSVWTRHQLVSATCSLAVALSGCSLLKPVPAYQLNVTDTAWAVVEIDHVIIAADVRPTLRFPDHGHDKVTVMTGCRTIALDFALDTDGAGLGFVVPSGPPPPCSPDLTRQDEFFMAALAGVETRKVHSDSSIEFLGSQQIGLERAAPPGGST